MKTIGIICEYNPLHLGHLHQLRWIRSRIAEPAAIVCLMSGNFVQRGKPAIFSKDLRAAAALEAGADLVLELPVTRALGSAELFARGGVEILGKFCDFLCFGAEHADEAALLETAELLLSPEFSPNLREFLDAGLSFPAARQKALEALRAGTAPLTCPNDILGVEYCKAILQTGTAMRPLVIARAGDYHASEPDRENPSATALRALAESGRSIRSYVPTDLFEHASVHRLETGERAILWKLRTMTEEEFSLLPYGSEGLWRKLMHESRRQPDLASILAAVKSKRYTRTRLDRMVMCALLGITEAQLEAPVPYTRILGFSPAGRALIKSIRSTGSFYNVGEAVQDPYWDLEQRCGDLYGLFREGVPDAPGLEKRQRIISWQP